MKNFFSNFTNKINELKKTERGKAILFFAFYLVFFVALSIYSRNIPRDAISKDGKDDDLFYISKLNGTNYAYNYIINVDNFIAEIDGKRNDEIEQFKYSFNNQTNEFFKSGLVYYKNGVMIESPNNLLSIIDNIDRLIVKATYDSVTSYQSGKEVLRYNISSSTLSNIIDNVEVDVDDMPDEIVLTKVNDKISEIEMRLDNYCKVTKKCMSKMQINMKYSSFDEIEEIVNPMNN